MEVFKGEIDGVKSEDLIDFIRISSRDFYSRKILEWQYKNPESKLFLVGDEGNILGTQGMIRYDLIFNDRSFISHKSETTFLAESLRGKGMFEKLYAGSVAGAYETGSQFIWGFTALGTLWERKLKFGYDDSCIHEASLVCGISKDSGIARKLYHGLKILKTKSKLFSANEKYTVEAEDFADLDFVDDYKDYFMRNSVRLDYQSESVKNRVFNSPVLKYQKLVVRKNGLEMAVLIVAHNKYDLNISDVLCKPDISLKNLLKAVFRYAAHQKLNVIRFWGNIHNLKYKEIFDAFKENSGRIEPVRDMQLIYQFRNEELEKLDRSSYYINGLWTEGFAY